MISKHCAYEQSHELRMRFELQEHRWLYFFYSNKATTIRQNNQKYRIENVRRRKVSRLKPLNQKPKNRTTEKPFNYFPFPFVRFSLHSIRSFLRSFVGLFVFVFSFESFHPPRRFFVFVFFLFMLAKILSGLRSDFTLAKFFKFNAFAKYLTFTFSMFSIMDGRGGVESAKASERK